MGQKSSPSPTMVVDWATKTAIKEIFAEQIWVYHRTADSNPGLPAVELIWIYHMFYQCASHPRFHDYLS
jgi:hypothetical protein